MNNATPIKLYIKSSQADDRGVMDSMEFFTEGRYFEKYNSTYISYEESGISGLEGTITVLKLSSGEAALIRNGTLRSRMNFRVGCETKNQYETEYGMFDLSVYTQELDINICNGRINSVYLKYRLRINSGEAYTNEMKINISYPE